jgi:16S rRNA (cytosine1402-N4)-methyltransferase
MRGQNQVAGVGSRAFPFRRLSCPQMSENSRNPSADKPAVHVPVLLRETIRYLYLSPGMTVVDGTVGGCGHSRVILEHIGPTGTLIGLDRDPMMLKKAAAVLAAACPDGSSEAMSGSASFPGADDSLRDRLPRNCHLRHASYVELPRVLEELGITAVDRILLDLGLSSDQLADEERGFAFASGGPLDLRFDVSQGEPAWQLLERADESELARIFHEYGEERYSRRIAAQIVSLRRSRPVHTARDLVDAVAESLPGKVRQEARKQPATRVFQALRIAVNDELAQVERALNDVLPDCLALGGRVVVLSFHSLEDKLVKQAFRSDARWQNLTPKPITATPAEQRMNPRSRTAKLRAASRL